MWRRAFKDTLPELGNSWGKGIRNVLFLAIALIFVRWFGGGEQMSEEARWLLSSGIALLIVLAGLFLFNLIRAPVYLKFEKGRLQRIHVELWGYGSCLLSNQFGKFGRGAHNINLTVTNQSDSIPLGIAKFRLEVPGTVLPLHPINSDELQGLTGFGGVELLPRDAEPMPHNLYLKPKESRTGQLVFVHDGSMHKQKLYITDEGGTSWTINIDGSTLAKMGKRRAEDTHEL